MTEKGQRRDVQIDFSGISLKCRLPTGASADPMRAATLPDRSEAAVIDSWGWDSQGQQHKSLLEPFPILQKLVSCFPLKRTMQMFRMVSVGIAVKCGFIRIWWKLVSEPSDKLSCKITET